jgi:hypothetical protein
MHEACVLGKGFVTGCDSLGPDSSAEDSDGDTSSCLRTSCFEVDAVAWLVLLCMRADIEGGVKCEIAHQPVRVVERL